MIITNKKIIIINEDTCEEVVLEGDVGAHDRTLYLGCLPVPDSLAGVWHFYNPNSPAIDWNQAAVLYSQGLFTSRFASHLRSYLSNWEETADRKAKTYVFP